MEGRRGRKIRKRVMKSSEDEKVHMAVKGKKREEMIEEERWEEGIQEEMKERSKRSRNIRKEERNEIGKKTSQKICGE